MYCKKIISLLTAAALTATAAMSLSSCGNKSTDDTTVAPITEDGVTSDGENTTSEVQTGTINPFTGLSGFEAQGQKPVAIVVENTPAARPQWGLTSPDMLFEYEVEGGITRMLWLYADINDVPDTVGPIRSARHDAVELALGLDALFIHCGGSNFAYDKIEQYSGTLKDIDGMNSQSFFVRNTTRDTATEHRLTLKANGLREYVANNIDMTLTSGYEHPFSFNSAVTTPAGTACNSIYFAFSGSYTYEFNYNSSDGLYYCDINSSARKDDDGNQCAYENVLVLYTAMSTIDSTGHQELDLTGGSGIYLSNGVSQQITWAKGSDRDMLKLYASDGSTLSLNPGKSYIGFVRSTQSGYTKLG